MDMFKGIDLAELEAEMTRRRLLQSFDERPKRIILIRHGESEGNTDRTAYARTPDSKIRLTEKGFAQAVVAGLQMRQLVGNETTRFFVSPYMRARQTVLAILRAFDGQTVQVSSEPRLREQDFGNFQSPVQMEEVFQERQQFGRFYYRFPDGEAGTDVYDRMASFITYLFRSMGETSSTYFQGGDQAVPKAENFVLVTHGLLMRIFCMCYLRWTVAEFEEVWNPSNCEMWVLEKIPEKGTYELRGRWRASPFRGEFADLKFGASKNEPLYEHMRRPLVARTVTPGAPDALDSDELSFLRDLPGPAPRGGKKGTGSRAPEQGRDVLESHVESVLNYWSKDTGRAAKDTASEV